MAIYKNYQAGMQLVITENGEDVYYRFGEANFNGKNGSDFKIAPNFHVLSQDMYSTIIRVFLDWVSLGAWGSGSRVYGYINSTQLENSYTSISANQSLYMGCKDITIYHNDTTGQGSVNVNCLVDTAWTLGDAESNTTIYTNVYPRASEPTCNANCYIANYIRLNTNRKTSEFLHTLSYNFNGMTGTIAQNVGDYVDWQVPVSFYQAIPNTTSGTCTIYCTTYRNGSQVGDTKTCTFTVLANESAVKPDASINVIDTNKVLDTGLRVLALTGDDEFKTLIRYLSDAAVTLTSSAKNNAKIISSNIVYSGNTVSVNPNAASYTHNQTFYNIENLNFSGFVSDSRGYPTTRETKTPTDLTLIPYVKLTLNKPEFYRPNQTGSTLRVKGSGNYFDGSFGGTNNSLTFEIRWYDPDTSSWTDWQTKQMTISNNSYSFDFQLGTNFNYQKSYKFQIQVRDKAMILPVYEESSPPGIPIIGFGEDIIEAFGDVIFYKD